MESKKPLVVITCITYNHEKYIRDALEGFVMQKTDFPYIAIVHDDASTDGTAEVIREYAKLYPNIIKPIFETENQYSKGDGSLGRIIREAIFSSGAKYVAFCEGDDYWISADKLSRQIQFLESHPNYGMIYGKVNRIFSTSGKKIDVFGGNVKSFEELLSRNSIPTPSAVIRLDLYEQYFKKIKPENKGWMMGDYPVWLYIALVSKIKFDNQIYANYRIVANSASHPKDNELKYEFKINYRRIAYYYAKQTNNKSIEAIQADIDFLELCKKLYLGDRHLKCDLKKLMRSNTLSLRRKIFIILTICNYNIAKLYVHKWIKEN